SGIPDRPFVPMDDRHLCWPLCAKQLNGSTGRLVCAQVCSHFLLQLQFSFSLLHTLKKSRSQPVWIQHLRFFTSESMPGSLKSTDSKWICAPARQRVRPFHW